MPKTAAVNWFWALTFNVKVAGLRATELMLDELEGTVTVTLAVEVLLGSCTLVAVTTSPPPLEGAV